MPRNDDSMNFEEDLKINKHRLDREFINHPLMQMRYGTLAAQASAEAKRAEERVKVIRSEIIIEILAKGDKPTGQVLEALYRTDKRHIKAKEEYVKVTETDELLQNAISAMRARRSSLENLAQLQAAGYYSSPRAPEGSALGSNEVLQEGAKDKVKDKAKRRKS